MTQVREPGLPARRRGVGSALLGSGPVPGVDEENLEGSSHLVPAWRADPQGEVCLEGLHVAAGHGEALESSLGEADDHPPAVNGVRVAADDPAPLQLIDDLGDRLAGDAGVGCQIAGAGAVLAEIAQHQVVPGQEFGEAGARERGMYLAIDEGVRVAEQDLEASPHHHKNIVHLG